MNNIPRPRGDVDVCRVAHTGAPYPGRPASPEHGRSVAPSRATRRRLSSSTRRPRFQNSAPPTRDPSNPNYPRATGLPDGTLPPSGTEGNFIIGRPTHRPRDRRQEGRAARHVTSFTLSSKDSLIYNPADPHDPAGCNNGSIMVAMTAPGDNSEHDRHHQPSGPDARDRRYGRRNMCAHGGAFIVIGDGGSTA
jgi:hypothetical protein